MQYISSVTAYFGFFKFTYEIKVLKLGLSKHYSTYFIKLSHSKRPSSNSGLKQYKWCLICKAVTKILGIHNFLVQELSSSMALMGNPLAFCKVYFILQSLYLCVLYNITYTVNIWGQSEKKNSLNETPRPSSPYIRPVHVLLSRFYLYFFLILSWFCPDFVLILFWFCPDFFLILHWFCPDFALILPWLYSDFILILFWFYPDFILILP